MVQSSKAGRWQLMFAAMFFALALAAFARARVAATGHTLVFLPDRFGGFGDTWTWPAQAYFLSAFCAVISIWLLVRFFRARP
jgi:hypothetical protein